MEQRMKNVLNVVNLWRMGVLWVFAVLYSYVKLYRAILTGSARRFPPPERINRKLACIVTGASSGIGKAVAEALALKGYYVILAGRSLPDLLKVVKQLELRHSKISVKALELDLTSVMSIIRFKEGVKELLEVHNGQISLQLLVNNAGVLAATKRLTPEGIDYMIASNYTGHFMLTQMLVPLMRKSERPARIVNVGSFTHRCVHNKDMLLQSLDAREMQKLEDFKNKRTYPIAQIYEATKLFMVLFTYELHRRHTSGSTSPQITAMTADPGIVHSNILRELPRWLSSCVNFVLRITGLMQSPKIGCKSVIDAAMAPHGVSGKYFFGGNGHTVSSSTMSYSQVLGKDVWDRSIMLFKYVLAHHKVALQEWQE